LSCSSYGQSDFDKILKGLPLVNGYENMLEGCGMKRNVKTMSLSFTSTKVRFGDFATGGYYFETLQEMEHLLIMSKCAIFYNLFQNI